MSKALKYAIIILAAIFGSFLLFVMVKSFLEDAVSGLGLPRLVLVIGNVFYIFILIAIIVLLEKFLPGNQRLDTAAKWLGRAAGAIIVFVVIADVYEMMVPQTGRTKIKTAAESTRDALIEGVVSLAPADNTQKVYRPILCEVVSSVRVSTLSISSTGAATLAYASTLAVGASVIIDGSPQSAGVITADNGGGVVWVRMLKLAPNGVSYEVTDKYIPRPAACLEIVSGEEKLGINIPMKGKEHVFASNNWFSASRILDLTKCYDIEGIGTPVQYRFKSQGKWLKEKTISIGFMKRLCPSGVETQILGVKGKKIKYRESR